jgi:hypothetical protein
MLRQGLAVALVGVSLAATAQVASADPTNAKKSQIVTAICGSQQFVVSINGSGDYTPGHLLGSTAVFVPTSFSITFSFTPTGGTTESGTDTAAKHNAPGDIVTCAIPANLNTFTGPEGTFTLSGSVTGFFTPANGA